jgi:hypothetical protein
VLGAGDWADTNIPTMEARPIAEMTTNFVLGDFIIYPGLTENRLIGKRKKPIATLRVAAWILKRRQLLDESAVADDSTL